MLCRLGRHRQAVVNSRGDSLTNEPWIGTWLQRPLRPVRAQAIGPEIVLGIVVGGYVDLENGSAAAASGPVDTYHVRWETGDSGYVGIDDI